MSRNQTAFIVGSLGSCFGVPALRGAGRLITGGPIDVHMAETDFFVLSFIVLYILGYLFASDPKK